ncbi:SDR family NAD(P)-dependent oxidoreductase [Kocuria sp.]|uniref:SDR family NAD(P)-dependent oxidoreductase n=1 Tax=Kocuria sp. TaxID=1871328 RepID=UPI0026DF01F8|nr:SDR family NAD(P)-dependent oxidoreductase [Kocuria sp.]MDO5618113.1 SDR family NAD(P)-dependent oxidoreductase [Kocuria sp.]
MRNSLPPLSLPDQSGRTWLVTGATNGLGREVAQSAASAGARVLLAVRDVERGQQVARGLSDASVVPLDLADLASVRAAAAAVTEPVDVVVNNAGTVSGQRRETVDGFELMLGTNALGPFAFTNLILPLVKDRIVIVGSGAHRWTRMDFADPHFTRRKFSFQVGYGQSKLAGMLWGLGLSRRLARTPPAAVIPTSARTPAAHRLNDDDAHPAVQLAHPGWAHTNLQNQTSWKVVSGLVGAAAIFGGQSAQDGAQNILVAATRDLPECSYVGPDGRGEMKGAPSLVGRSAHASNPELADVFWEFAQAATGTQFPAM